MAWADRFRLPHQRLEPRLLPTQIQDRSAAETQNVCQRTDARSVVTGYYYDALNRLIGKSYTIPQGSSVAAMPNVLTTSMGQSANVRFNYDQGGAAAYALGRAPR